MDELTQLLQSLPPEQLAQLLNMGTLDERSGMKQQQMALAEALRRTPTQQRTTLGGAIGEGLGGLANAIGGGIGVNQAQQGLEGLLSQKDAGRSLLADVLRRAPGVGGTPDDSLQKQKVVDLSALVGAGGY